MVKCEGCGEYHPVEDCEIIIIKVVKGKACHLPPTGTKPVFQTEYSVPVNAKHPIAPTTTEKLSVDQEAMKAIIKKRQSVPPAFLGEMFRPGNESSM